MLNENLQRYLIGHTHATEIKTLEKLQSLWSGYGAIIKVHLIGGPYQSVVIKNIELPEDVKHPRGWNTNHSHLRKVRSYEVEMHWYNTLASKCSSDSKIPEHIHSSSDDAGDIIILQDIDAAGFPLRKSWLEKQETLPCLRWLAHFHATFMGIEPKGLWETGTYWHLQTRPDELEAMEDGPLKAAAAEIDEKLEQCRFKTIVHGDAKVANFCFSEDSKSVAAVDFQYVGGGCGIKDVIYFLGSCLDENQCEKWEQELLDFYFSELRTALAGKLSSIEIDAIEQEWRQLYPVAWTDFYRFLKGWMPGHFKINSYSDKLAEQVLQDLG